MKNLTTRRLAVSGMIGAAYAVMAIFGSVFGLTFGPIQFRFSEALCVLPFLFPEAVGGLFVGCLIANLFSPYGLLDIVVGSLATLLAAWLTSRCRSRYLAPLPPVIVNMVLVGGLLAFEQAGGTGFTKAFMAAFWYNACSLAVSEAVVCYVLGLLLLKALEKTKYFKELQKKD